MNNRKLMEYSRGRMDGLLMAEKIVREQGIEALQREIKFRNEAGVHTTHTISMNNILKYRGYRFYQSSYDEDGQGSLLSVPIA